MENPPYHVAGGAFIAPARPGQQIANLQETRTKSTRRRKLWELSHKCHCPVIGTCFDVTELRSLLRKAMHFPHDATDFVLHTSAVGHCESRSPVAEVLQKQLEKRYPLTIRQFAVARHTAALTKLWREAVAAGTGIPAALWATLTHPACDGALEQEVYADIHMIQHQIGSGNRADMKALKHLRDDNAALRHQLANARHETESLRAERAAETQTLGQRIVELRADLAGRDARIAHLTGEYERLRDSLPALKERQTLVQRAATAEALYLTFARQIEEQREEIHRLKEQLSQARETVAQLTAPTASEDAVSDACDDASPQLSGKCVLCVGGRSGSVDAYRQLVEKSGGRFIHHDGGLEESLHRIDGALTAADLVICQAGCISHNAYWRVKEQCKRTGKRCLFVRNSGISSFGRVLDEAMAESQNG